MQALLQRLKFAAQEAERAGEVMVAAVSSGQLSPDAWTEQYIKARAAFHARDLKYQAAQLSIPQA